MPVINMQVKRFICNGLVQVYKGLYKDVPVAVKVCRKATLNSSAMRQFQKEVAILQNCSHENLVSFIGACTWKVRLLYTAFMPLLCQCQEIDS